MEFISLCISMKKKRFEQNRGQGMQGIIEGELTLTEWIFPRFYFFDKDNNKLGDKGVAYISKANWGRLRKFLYVIKS